MDRPKEEITAEMERLYEFREQAWYEDQKATPLVFKDEFAPPLELKSMGYYRNSKCLAFNFNIADPKHNVSLVVVNGLKFLPSDAPSEA